MDLGSAALGAEATAAAVGVLLARRRPAHAPAAVALAVLAAASLARVFVSRALPLPQPTPIEGFEGRALLAADSALYLAANAAVAALPAWLAFQPSPGEPPRSRRIAIVAIVATWALVVVLLAALYPSPLVRGTGRARVYLAADLASLAVATIALLRRAARSARSPGSPEVVALALIVCDVALLVTPLSPWRLGALFDGAAYVVPRIVILGIFGALTFYQGVLWRFSAD